MGVVYLAHDPQIDRPVALKVLRAERDWTQAELADRVGVSRKTINTIERGVFVPSTLLALRLARVFAVPLEEIFALRD